jgi:hypothetical protein
VREKLKTDNKANTRAGGPGNRQAETPITNVFNKLTIGEVNGIHVDA